jgi:hypothetical protein
MDTDQIERFGAEPTQRCTKCRLTHPHTREFFYYDRRDRDGNFKLGRRCIECAKRQALKSKGGPKDIGPIRLSGILRYLTLPMNGSVTMVSFGQPAASQQSLAGRIRSGARPARPAGTG